MQLIFKGQTERAIQKQSVSFVIHEVPTALYEEIAKKVKDELHMTSFKDYTLSIEINVKVEKNDS